VPPQHVAQLAGEGSSRKYYRLTDAGGRSVIGTIGDDIAENEAYFAFSRHFEQVSLPVPSLLGVSDDRMVYLQEDLGDISLYNIVKTNGVDSTTVKNLLRQSLDMLARFHAEGTRQAPFERCYPRPKMDERSVTWDLNYFKYCFLKPVGVRMDEERLENVFDVIRELIVAGDGKAVLLLRDFQSRNVMVKSGKTYAIDFQGARIGNGLYDVASFLWQARIGLPDVDKWQYAAEYIESARDLGLNYGVDWVGELRIMALFRMLQVLGCYGYRGLYEKKAQFVTSISPALRSALLLLEEIDDERFAYLNQLLEAVSAYARFQTSQSKRLTVRVTSFSYKKGIPEDYSGNGGGFVFDCRALNNPGRYAEYKQLTGLDRPVIDFLEHDGGILKFLDHCYELVDVSVARYIERGFTDLNVSFGCTGGQHRSVYSAQRMAEHIARKFDCNVKLAHREQGIYEEL